MGAPISELMVDRLLRVGLEEVRRRPSLLDVLLERLNEGAFEELYGKQSIDQFKEYITKRQISITLNPSLLPEHIPGYTIHLLGATEASDISYFDDYEHDQMTDLPLSEQEVVMTFAIDTYEDSTGFVSVLDGVDLSNLYAGALLRDSDDVTFEVFGPIINETGRKGFYIVANATIQIGTVTIYSQIVQSKTIHMSIPIRERIRIGCHGLEKTNIAKYLYYIAIYFLSSRRLELENAGYQIHNFSASDLMTGDNETMPDLVRSRNVDVEFLTNLSWQSDPLFGTKNIFNKIFVPQYVWVKDDNTAIGTTTE